MIQLGTGEIGMAIEGKVLTSGPLGSCIVVVLFSQNSRQAGLAHIMLPGRSPDPAHINANRYACTAIDNLLMMLTVRGVPRDLLASLVLGAGNVLRRHDDTICRDNTAAVLWYLDELNIPVMASDLGGEQRRTVTIDLTRGEIRRTVGDLPEEVFFKLV